MKKKKVCTLPCDYLSKEEIKKLSGEVIIYNIKDLEVDKNGNSKGTT